MATSDDEEASEVLSQPDDSTSSPHRTEEDQTDEMTYVISAETDPSNTGSSKTFLKYKNKIKRNFKAPIKLAEQIIKVENVINRKKNDNDIGSSRRTKVISNKTISAKRIATLGKKPIDNTADILTTPSELTIAPSDFEHVFHSPRQSKISPSSSPTNSNKTKKNPMPNDELINTALKKAFAENDFLVPIFTLDDKAMPKIINVHLSRLNQLSRQLASDLKKPETSDKAHKKATPKSSNKSIKSQPVPKSDARSIPRCSPQPLVQSMPRMIKQVKGIPEIKLKTSAIKTTVVQTTVSSKRDVKKDSSTTKQKIEKKTNS